MHEMSLAEGVIQLIEQHAKEKNFNQVTMVHLEIGQLSNVEVEAMRFCFDAVCENSIANGATLKISESPGVGWCMECEKQISYQALYQPCPDCEGHQIQVTGGNEMLIKELEVN